MVTSMKLSIQNSECSGGYCKKHHRLIKISAKDLRFPFFYIYNSPTMCIIERERESQRERVYVIKQKDFRNRSLNPTATFSFTFSLLPF